MTHLDIEHKYTRRDLEKFDAREAMDYSTALATIAAHLGDTATHQKAMDSIRSLFIGETVDFGGMTVARVMHPGAIPDGNVDGDLYSLRDAYKLYGMTCSEGYGGTVGTFVATWSLHS